MLLVNDGVQFELVAEFIQRSGFGDEMVGDVIAIAESLAAVGELAFADAVDLLELGAFGFDFTAEVADEGIDRIFFASGVEDDEAFVITFLGILVGWVCVRKVWGRGVV